MNIHLPLDRDGEVSLQDQLFEQLRRLIVNGALKPNTRVIATRFLAEQLGVSRTTVLLVYERLISEGYLETRPAIGTFVSAALPDAVVLKQVPVTPKDAPRQAELRPATLPGLSALQSRDGESGIDFTRLHHETTQLLPQKYWLRGVRSVLDNGHAAAETPPLGGVTSLRQAICDHLAMTRGMAVSPEQVIIADGRRQACSYIAHLFQQRGDRVVVEAPCDERLQMLFNLRGAEVVPVHVDENGLDPWQLPGGDIKLAYVSPTCQNILGVTMPTERRKALIDWARDAGAYLIEDDSDSEMRFTSAPPPLMALDPYGLVFFVGSFAKSLGVGLGISYVVAPPEFTDAILALKLFGDGGRQWLEQMVVADLLNSGAYAHHLRQLRKQNLELRDCLNSELQFRFRNVRLLGTEAAGYLTWLLPNEFPDIATLTTVARAHGVVLNGVCPPSARQRAERVCTFCCARIRTSTYR